MELVQTIAGGEREPGGKPRGGPRLPDCVLSQVRNWNSHATGRFLHAAWRGRRDNVRCPVCRSARDLAGSSLDERRGKDHASRLAMVSVDAAEGELCADPSDLVRIRADDRDREQIRKLEVVEAD